MKLILCTTYLLFFSSIHAMNDPFEPRPKKQKATLAQWLEDKTKRLEEVKKEEATRQLRKEQEQFFVCGQALTHQNNHQNQKV